MATNNPGPPPKQSRDFNSSAWQDWFYKISVHVTGQFQPSNDNLTSISGLTGSGFGVQTSTGNWILRSLAAGTGVAITNPDGSGGNPIISVGATWYDTGYSYQTPTTGFSITLGNTTTHTILDPAGTLASGTIVMAASPSDGLIATVSSTQTITALTVSPNTGQTVQNAPTTLTAGSGFSYIYRSANNTWYRLQ